MPIEMVLIAVSAAVAAGETPLLDPDDAAYLEDLAKAVVDASRVAPGAMIGDVGPNTSGGTLIRPGGRTSYPAFWIRDYAMSLEGGLIPPDEQRHHLLHTARHQQDETVELPTGSVLPARSIPDHIGLGGIPIFFPGNLQDYETQGGPLWGLLPCLDNHFFFIHMAAEYVRQTGDRAVLHEQVDGKPVLQRLEEAYAMPPSRPNGIVYATEERRGVNFGFLDTVIHTGDLFFATILKLRAARELAALLDAEGRTEDAGRYRDEAGRLQQAIEETFSLPDGWFRASTGASGQVDVWGTAFAVYIGALTPEREKAACKALAEACRAGTIAWRGQIRHVPTDRDFSAETVWERCYAPRNRYQNGAYWATPTGWVVCAIVKVDRDAARTLVREYVAAMREDDFRKGDAFGGPWECVHPEDNHRQNPVYMCSVTCPLAAIRRAAGEARP